MTEDTGLDPDLKRDMEAHMKAAPVTGALSFVLPLGALITTFWLLYLVWRQAGLLDASGAFLGMSVVYGFGVAPMFAVAASLLCFYFHVIGMWLPIASYALAAVSLYVDVKTDRLKRRIDPLGLFGR